MPPPTERARNLRLILVRHGPSATRDPRRWPDDDRRPLTAKGRSETRSAARGMVETVPAIDRLISSGASRALETARLLAKALPGRTTIQIWPELDPSHPPAPVLERLGRTAGPDEVVVLVGHEPALSELVGLALVGDAVSFVRIAKAGAACLEFPRRLRPGAARLLWLLSRKQLAARGA